MKAKIIWATLLTLTAAILVIGAVNRTEAKVATAERTGDEVGYQGGRAVLEDEAVEGDDTTAGEPGLGQGRNAVEGPLGSGQASEPRGGQGLGGGRNAIERDAVTGGAAEPRGGQGAQGDRGALGDDDQGGYQGGRGEGQAELQELITVEGTVVSMDEEALLLTTTAGESLAIENRAWTFALENGFAAAPQDAVTVTGFYDADHFEPVTIINVASGQEMQLREASGRPLWAGGRGGNGGNGGAGASGT